jgi:hypothetical protein
MSPFLCLKMAELKRQFASSYRMKRLIKTVGDAVL